MKKAPQISSGGLFCVVLGGFFSTIGFTALTPLHQQLEQLALNVDSTLMTAGSEAYGNSLTIYNNIKFLAHNKQAGAQTAFDDLKQRFAGQGKKKAAAAQASAN